MVRMGAVWDSTVEVFAGRGATIVRVAMLTVFLPAVIQAALPLALGAGNVTFLVGGIVGLVVVVVALLGTLAITALASDPTTDERTAYAVAGERIGVTIGVLILIGVAMSVLVLPGVILLVAAGIDPNAFEAGKPQPVLSPGMLLGATLYMLVFAVLALWLTARLLPLYAVLVNERRGIGAIRRTFAMTRGLAFRLVAVLILYALVMTVAWMAARSVTGLVFRLLLGSDQAALVGFVSEVAGAVVTTAFGTLQPVFAARLYAAIRDTREGSAKLA